MNGPVMKKGHIFELDSYDKFYRDRVELCIGHGSYFTLKRGSDVEIVDETITTA
jgi:hypothetical protein